MDLLKETDFKPDILVASKRSRMLAFILDFLIFIIAGFLIGIVFDQPSDIDFGFDLTGFPALLLMSIGVFLWPVSEALWGQTIGKRTLHLKVVTDGTYKPIDKKHAAIRFILGPIDCMMASGLIVALSTKNNKRIGDWAAGTVVIDTFDTTFFNANP